MEANHLSGKTIIYVVTEDWYFCSHRLPIARAARDAGMKVVVATHVTMHRERIVNEGFRLIPLKMRRRNNNPLRELAAIVEIFSIYRRERPDLVHHVALKPVLYGSIAARMVCGPAVVNALAGMGYVFSSNSKQARLISFFVRRAFRLLFNSPRTHILLQNPDDRRLLIDSGAVLPERTEVISGSGVDTRRFCPLPEPESGPTVVTLVARMIRAKGIVEFVEAARILKQDGLSLNAVLVGTPDPANPTSIEESRLESWDSEGWVQWKGHDGDIPRVWAQSHIAVLPSFYGEGVPKSLIEAAACGRPIVTTDTPGCREIVLDGVNGILVPTRDAQSLAEAIRKLVSDPVLRRQMGRNGRKLVEDRFSETVVVSKTLEMYRSLLGEC